MIPNKNNMINVIQKLALNIHEKKYAAIIVSKKSAIAILKIRYL
jgi:hypothetical protein